MSFVISFLQIAVSLIFFTNKVLVLVGKKSGWLVGMIAATLATAYFFLIGLYVFTTLEIGLIVLMGYGFLAENKKRLRVEKLINTTSAITMFTLMFFVFSGKMTVVEFLSSVLLLIGTYHLTHKKVALGWTLYAFAHIGAAWIGYHKEQFFFADFQVASVIVSIVGVVLTWKKPLSL